MNQLDVEASWSNRPGSIKKKQTWKELQDKGMCAGSFVCACALRLCVGDVWALGLIGSAQRWLAITDIAYVEDSAVVPEVRAAVFRFLRLATRRRAARS